jgi:hypothetical protein
MGLDAGQGKLNVCQCALRPRHVRVMMIIAFQARPSQLVLSILLRLSIDSRGGSTIALPWSCYLSQVPICGVA